MKRFALLVPFLAAVALFAQPALAADAPRHEKCVHAAKEATAAPAEKMGDHENLMQESMEKMRAQMATIHQTKDPKKHQKLLQEHSKSLRDSLKMMREMMGDMAMGCGMKGDCMMGGGMMGGMKGECMMGGGMKGDCMMGGGMKGGMKGECMMGGSPVSQPDVKADAAPAAQANPGPVAAADKTSPSPEKKLWVCPMHPDVVQDHPGACPICGMDLVEMGQPGTSQPGHCHMMGGGMKDGGMMGGGMKKITGKHMDMMLLLMEQMLEHNEAAMPARK